MLRDIDSRTALCLPNLFGNKGSVDASNYLTRLGISIVIFHHCGIRVEGTYMGGL